MMMKKPILPISVVGLFLLFSAVCQAAEVTMAWDASSGDPAGYRIYYGTVFGTYSNSVDVGNVTEYTLSGLQADVTYYFVVRAYNDSGESGNSNEVSWIYETADTTPPVVSAPGPFASSESVISLNGTASDNKGVAEVRWANDRGGSGIAQGTTGWTIGGISLAEGENVITISAIDAAGNVGSAAVHVTYSPPASGDDESTAVFGNVAGADHSGTIEDTFTNAGETNVNYSANSQQLIIYTWPAGTNANAILMKWNLAAIPADAQVQSATLYLYQSGYEDTGGDDLYEISVHKIIQHDPDISQCTWSTYDGVNAWTGGATGGLSDVAAAEDIRMVDKSSGYKQWNVTRMVRDWVAAPGANFGLMLLSDQGANKASQSTNRFFVPTENADANRRPKLVITYSSSGSGPSPDAPPSPPSGFRVVE